VPPQHRHHRRRGGFAAAFGAELAAGVLPALAGVIPVEAELRELAADRLGGLLGERDPWGCPEPAGSERSPPGGRQGGEQWGMGGGANGSSKPNDGAGLGTRKGRDGVRVAAGVSGLGLVLFASEKKSPAGARDV